MGTRSKVVIGLLPLVDGVVPGHDKLDTFENLLALRKWCRGNLKDGWRTHEIIAGGGTEKHFFVFEFDSQKDEMLFRLKQGI